jgi:DNA-binding NarL/FixJ family response regulator
LAAALTEIQQLLDAFPLDEPAEPPADLTPREVEVLQLVAEGLTNAQIAERLIIRRRTVNAHLRSIYSKLDVSNRTAGACPII